MSGLFDRWKAVYVVLVVLLVSFFALSGIGNTGTDAENSANSSGWVGSDFWIAFGVTVLVAIAYSVGLLIHRMRGRSQTA